VAVELRGWSFERAAEPVTLVSFTGDLLGESFQHRSIHHFSVHPDGLHNVAPCTNGFVRVEGRQDYSFIQDAYTAALPDDVIKVQALGFTENLLFNADKRVTITGGYDCPYAVTGGPLTIVHGSLTVGGPASGSGGVTIGNLTIR
jgi:hypothetical protein